MRLDSAHLEHARQVADAILYEGYLLYPYRGSAQKNQARFQFGVLVPPAYAAVDDCERTASQTECLVECPDDAEVLVMVRFLQMQRRSVQAASPDTGELRDVEVLRVDGDEYTSWDEAAERQQHAGGRAVSALLGQERGTWSSTSAAARAARISPTPRAPGRAAGPALGRARRPDPAERRARRRPVPGAAAAGPAGEPHGAGDRRRAPGTRPCATR